MATAAPAPGGPNKKLLIGLGVGCGCLSLIGGIVAIVIVMSVARQSGGPGPGPAPGPRPPAPAPGPGPGPAPGPAPGPGPRGQPEGPPDLQVIAAMVRLEGDRVAGETDTYSQGEKAAAAGQFTTVRGQHQIVFLWVKRDGDKIVPVVDPKQAQINESVQGRSFVQTLSGAPAGEYAWGILRSVNGQYERIVVRPFRVQ